MHFVCDLCDVALIAPAHTSIFSNVQTDYDMCAPCHQENPQTAQDNAVVETTVTIRMANWLAQQPEAPAMWQAWVAANAANAQPFVPAGQGPNMMAPLFHPVYNPNNPARVKKRKLFKCWDAKGGVHLEAVAEDDHEEILKIMKTHSRMDAISWVQAKEEGLEPPKGEWFPRVDPDESKWPKKKDKCRVTGPADSGLVGQLATLIGVDHPDGIIKMIENSDVKIVPMKYLETVTEGV